MNQDFQLSDRQTIVCERVIPVGRDRFWQAIATREGLAEWFMPTNAEIVKGGRFSFQEGWEGVITQVTDREAIQFEPDDAGGAFLRFEIAAVDEGCNFRLIDRMGAGKLAKNLMPQAPEYVVYQPGGPGTHWAGVVAGYHCFVNELQSHLTGTQAGSDYDDLCRHYQALMDQWHNLQT